MVSLIISLNATVSFTFSKAFTIIHSQDTPLPSVNSKYTSLNDVIKNLWYILVKNMLIWELLVHKFRAEWRTSCGKR